MSTRKPNPMALVVVAGLAGLASIDSMPAYGNRHDAGRQHRFGGGPNRKAGDAKKAQRKNQQKGRRAARGK